MKKILGILFIALATIFAGCEREFDQPLLQEPVYDGEANLTTSGFREMFADATTNPEMITVDYVVTGYITGNDETGNIYKQLFIDDGTGGLCISIDQNSIYTTHRVGQEVFINLHGLYTLKYGGELQVGYLNPDASNRVPWEIYVEHEHFNGYPDSERVKPHLLEISQLNSYDADQIVHRLVRFDNVRFQNGGKNPFSSTTVTTNEPLLDAAGNSLDVRTSAYSTFVSEILPVGYGTVVGILGRYNGAWQLTVRGLEDVFNFPDDEGGDNGGDIGGGDNGGSGSDGYTRFFYETFGTGDYPSGSRPKIAEFTDFDMKSVTYSDASGLTDIRSSNTMSAHAWFPISGDAYLTISGIDTSPYEEVTMKFDVAANTYGITGTTELSQMFTLTCNGTQLTTSSKAVTDSDQNFYTLTVNENITVGSSVVLEFHTSPATNTLGMRLDNITLEGKQP